MMELWITAWIISVVCASGAWICARRSGLGHVASAVVASIFFPAPLFVALGGGNSFVYAFDLTAPLAVGLTLLRWPRVPLTVKKAAGFLVAGAGLVPLLVAFFLADRESTLYTAISLYRLIGAMAVMGLMAAEGKRLEEGGAKLLLAVGWVNIVLVAATLLQSHGLINSNVFYGVGNDPAVEENDSMRYITAGLFRGSIGIIGALGWVSFLAQFQARGGRALAALVGGAAGGLLIILCGSKTSLLAAMLTTVAGCLLVRGMLQLLWKRLLLVLIGLAAVATVYLYAMDETYFSYTLGILGMSDQSLDTFNYRQERWQEATDLLQEDPKILMGVSTPFGSERGMAYFHNEYIGLLMSGGIWSEGGYLFGLFLLGRALLRRRAQASTPASFAGLTLLISLIQGASVNHVAPGIFFGSTVFMTACVYGLGLGGGEAEETATRPASVADDEVAEAATLDEVQA